MWHRFTETQGLCVCEIISCKILILLYLNFLTVSQPGRRSGGCLRNLPQTER
jgi:hypothetical protein